MRTIRLQLCCPDSATTRLGVNVIVIPVDRGERLGGDDSWWDVPVAEVSPLAPVNLARTEYDTAKRRTRQDL